MVCGTRRPAVGRGVAVGRGGEGGRGWGDGGSARVKSGVQTATRGSEDDLTR